jgi:hypothetical protein
MAKRKPMFKKESGNWTKYRQLPNHCEVDFHRSEYGGRTIPYSEAMEEVATDALKALENAYQTRLSFVIFTHGSSTSRPGKTTARSQVRKLMRSSDATPYIIRRDCIQHESVFVAAIKQNKDDS